MKQLKIGFLLVISGFILILVASLILFVTTTIEESITAFCIVVFFIPICFGKSPIWLLIILSIIVFIISIVFIIYTLFISSKVLVPNKVLNKKNIYSIRLT
ncbi:MAG: hypothetical protein QXP72_03085 [Desulfurococcaceae archaeon]